MKIDLSICRKCPMFETEMVDKTYPRFLYCKKKEEKKKRFHDIGENHPIGYGTMLFSWATIPEDCNFNLEYLMLQDGK